jgi:hypothetical protein
MSATALNFKVRNLSEGAMPKARALAKTLDQNLSTIARAARTKPYRIRSIRFRIYPFSRKEAANELFVQEGKKKYVCLNAGLLNKRKWAALQYMLHGIGHSLCYLRDGIGEEVFCEHVGYEALKQLIKGQSEKEKRRIIRSVMRTSSPEYRAFYRAARRITKKEHDKLVKLNNKAKHRKIAKHNEKRVIYRALKARRQYDSEDLDDNFPIDLEKGFRKV